MRHVKLFILSLVFWACTAPSASFAETLRIGIEEWPPWIIRHGESFNGIVVEVCMEAVRRAGHTSVLVEIPQKRRDLAEWGRMVNVEPGCEKSWRKAFDPVSAYTIPYIRTRNVVVSFKGAYPVTREIKTFYGETLGCNLGFYYTDGFNDAFDRGKIIRDDCSTGPGLMAKLMRKRYKAAITDTYEWKYWAKKQGQRISDFQEVYQFSHPNNLRIRLHASKAYLAGPLNKALESMTSDHTIDAIVKRYIKN